MNFTNKREFAASVTNNKGAKFKYICIKKSAEKDKKKIGYFFMERSGWVNIKISQVNIIALSIEVIKYSVIIKKLLKVVCFYYNLLWIKWQEEYHLRLKNVHLRQKM